MKEEIATPPRSSDLPFQVLMSGISYCDGTYRIRRNASPLTCIEYIIQGKGTVTEDDHTFTAQTGDIYILHEGQNHLYYSDGKEPWIKIWMNISGPAVDHLLSAYGLDLINHVKNLNLEQDFRQFYTTASNCRTAPEVSDRCSILFHGILQKIAAQMRDKRENRSETARKIKEIIDAAKGFDITLEDIAKQLFFTKTHLIRVFREEYQVTPYEYILSRKLHLATDLLLNTSLPVSEIAAYLNFCDAHYFTNFFRSRTGMTPREYRKRKIVRKTTMNIKTIKKDGRKIVWVESQTPVITDVQSALDLIMTAKYESNCKDIVINKEAICNEFFILSTGIAGEILQKFINYEARIAIYGDFSGYTSKPLQDFIYESNKGKDIFFQPDVDRAVDKLVQS